MSLLKRIKNIMSKPAPAPMPAQRSITTLSPGDMCEVSLVTYQVIGRTNNPRRASSLITLEDGIDIRYLLIEEQEQTTFALYQPVDGRLDSIYEVPMTIDLDECTYYLEEQYNGYITSIGKTPFPSGEQSVWQFQSDNKKLLRIEWMNGRFELFEGEHVLPADVEMIRGS